MVIGKACVPSDDGSIYTVDVIQVEGDFWLVPWWLESQELKLRRPAHMILLNAIQHQDLGDKLFGPHRFVLNSPVPKAVLNGGPSPLAHQFVLKIEPNITLPMGETMH